MDFEVPIVKKNILLVVLVMYCGHVHQRNTIGAHMSLGYTRVLSSTCNTNISNYLSLRQLGYCSVVHKAIIIGTIHNKSICGTVHKVIMGLSTIQL